MVPSWGGGGRDLPRPVPHALEPGTRWPGWGGGRTNLRSSFTALRAGNPDTRLNSSGFVLRTTCAWVVRNTLTHDTDALTGTEGEAKRSRRSGLEGRSESNPKRSLPQDESQVRRHLI